MPNARDISPATDNKYQFCIFVIKEVLGDEAFASLEAGQMSSDLVSMYRYRCKKEPEEKMSFTEIIIAL